MWLMECKLGKIVTKNEMSRERGNEGKVEIGK